VSALTVAALRQRVAAAVEALAAPSAWTESRWTYDRFPQAEPSQHAHLAFAVGAPSTVYDSVVESSRTRRGALGGAVTTTIGVRWAFMIRADAAVSDTDAMLAAEAVLLTALPGVSHANLHLNITSATRRGVGDSKWMLGDVLLEARHRLPIQ